MKKTAVLLLTAISCACLAFGFSACGDGGTSGGTNGGTSGDGSTTSSEHTMTYHAATEATCTEDGNTAYYYCSDCGKYFSDENGTTEIELSSTVISALGHEYAIEYTWTKASDGYTCEVTQYCTRCNVNIETVDATVELTSQSEATCTESGETVYTATATIGGETVTDVKTLTDPATGHTYSEDWSIDASYHWHAAICEHTDEVSDKAAHSYVNENGSYVCSVCGYVGTSFITSANDALAVGGNYIVLSDSDASIDNMTFTATASGEYTLTLASDCQAQIRMRDTYGTYTYLGLASASGNIYTASFDLAAGESLTIDYITAGNEVTLDSEYIFCLDVTYTEKEVAEIGTEGKPYAFTNPDNYGGDSTKATLAAGESYYFSVTSDSDILTQISFSNSGATSFELYRDGVKIDYGTYYFSSGTTTITFELKNISGGDIENTISCAMYEPSLSTSDNTVTVTSAMLDSTNSITYSVTFGASTTYTITLGDGTDSNVAVYYSDELILGSGATATSYNLTNSSSRNDRTYSITFTYTGDTIPDSFNIEISFEKYEAPVTYTALTLGTAAEAEMDYSQGITTINYSYSAASAGNYTLTLAFKQSTGTTFTWGNIYTQTTTVTVNGTTVSGTDEGVYVLSLSAGNNNISVTLSAKGTMSLTLTGGGSVDLGDELVIGVNDVVEYGSYYFTATDAGTYTFTVSGTGGGAQFYESSDSWTALFLEEDGSSVYEVTLTAGQTITLYVTNEGAGDFVITVAKS